MASQIFNVVNMRKGDQEKSFEWYRNQVRGLSRGVTGTQILRSEKHCLTTIWCRWCYLSENFLMDF
jgi:hypothetical protein